MIPSCFLTISVEMLIKISIKASLIVGNAKYFSMVLKMIYVMKDVSIGR